MRRQSNVQERKRDKIKIRKNKRREITAVQFNSQSAGLLNQLLKNNSKFGQAAVGCANFGAVFGAEVQ
jgi:hypothetical protein